MNSITIIGGGLAGSEAAWQLAQNNIKVNLYEMRPNNPTGAHLSGDLAELVCSNSLGSNLSDRASGVLKNELRQMNSMLLDCAEATALPAGAALAVDREAFARMVTQKIESHPNIEVTRAEMKKIPQTPVIIASGPLTSESLSQSIAQLSGEEHLFFFDAIAPIVHAESINMDVAFRASRYSKGDSVEGDYINCPFTKDEYYTFVHALQGAERIQLRTFEEAILNFKEKLMLPDRKGFSINHLFSNSSVFTQLWRITHPGYQIFLPEQNDSSFSVTRSYLNRINEISDNSGSRLLVSLIPHYADLNYKRLDSYPGLLDSFEILKPFTLAPEDYTAPQGEHFNNSGHGKFAAFLLDVLKTEVKKEKKKL